MVGQQGQQGIAQEGQIGEEVGLAAAGAVLAHEGIAAPVIADFHPAPVAANALEPLAGLVLARPGARQVIAGFGGGNAGLFGGPFAAQHDQGAGKREVGGQGFDGEGVEAAGFRAAMARFAVDKKGVPGSASNFFAIRCSLGWLPLIWSR